MEAPVDEWAGRQGVRKKKKDGDVSEQIHRKE